jgi:glycosyltransferase involved in cell wall biosynthesis
MKDNPLCTIIVPTIGRPKYIGAALASVMAQTYRPLEILISDNGTKTSVEIEEIQQQQVEVRLFRPLPALLEPARHFNLCLKEARGEYVFIMGDDDLMSPDYIAASVKCISGESSVNAVIARQTRIGEFFFGPISGAPIDFITLTGEEFVSQWAIEGKLPDVLTTFPMVVRRQQVLECGGIPEYADASHSTNTLILQLCLGAKLGILNGGYYYRIYPTSGGLTTPWCNLVKATQSYDRDLLVLYKTGRLKKNLFLALVLGNTGLLILRWKKLYRRRPGFANKVRPVLDIAFRIFNLGWRFGLGAVPKLHKCCSQ